MPAPLLDSCSLQHIRVRKFTSRGVSRSRYVPPSGFGYPLDGLLLPIPRRPCFVPTALVGFRPSESSPLRRYPTRFRTGWTHMPFFRAVSPTPKRRPFPLDRGSWALTLPRVPCARPVFSTPQRRILPWASPLSGLSCDSLDRDPSRSPLTRFLATPAGMPDRRPRVSIGPRLASSAPAGKPPGLDETTLLGFPHRSVPDHSGDRPLGLCVHLAPRSTLLLTADAL